MTEDPPRRRKRGRRSMTGCRTCRARRIKCDEAPTQCNNCAAAGLKCEGYDLSGAVPGLGADRGRETVLLLFPISLHPKPGRILRFPVMAATRSADESRDPAVYHAANALSALHEDSETTKLLLVGENLRRPLHRFALEQASRSFALLNRRCASQDPERLEIVLLCCLLFILAELLLGQYTRALQHLQGGLRILKEAPHTSKQRIPHCVIQAFRQLDVQSAHFGSGPFLFANDGLKELSDADFVRPLHNLEEVRRNMNSLLLAGIHFLANRWRLSSAQVQANYSKLCLRQQRLLSLYTRFRHQFETFYDRYYPSLSYRRQQSADIVRLQYRSQLVAIKTCLMKKPVPKDLIPEYEALLLAHEAYMAKFPERPTITLDLGIIPGLHTVAVNCPRYSLRLRAIKALLAWPHYEGIISSTFAASIAIVSLKAELEATNQHISSIIGEPEEELARYLFDTVTSTQNIPNWTTVRASRFLEHYKETKPSPTPESEQKSESNRQKKLVYR
ncbi:hypothetical protein ANOM_000352 [Aspergillus nomiae NRRL 13137]|uniref:Zn(2)-C6 fungal-type domain-containing protein n=1 Tax=Aspergillus nomiae NRRL (strain ATCC 15546 / NRRL 13137 / CBS 260.88 / M93) TaxID=1509407 RepID=A0A0L1JHT3_ASPN3|nr:uncharacterized protein ANOM_000352 [Aspergillus nomiae NRRL 13137]KNG91267.1 hypothetical protein ANOM_000352 [Aspergillus nomiae NRRL 13137]